MSLTVEAGSTTLRNEEECEEENALAEVRLGHSAAFSVLVRAHQSSVYSLSLRVLKDAELARDLAQEVFLQLYRKISDIESARHLKFWLRKVTMNLAIDKLRQQPKCEFQELDEDIEVAAEDTESDPLLARQLLRFVGELPPPARAVMLLKYQEDLDQTEIAAALEMSVNTVKSHLRRSLIAVRERVLAARTQVREGG